VLIFRVDRFSREPLDLLYLIQELNRLGIKLSSVTEAVDAGDPGGELMLTILGAIGKFVRSNIIQNAMLGKRKRAGYGLYTGGKVPFGYEVDANGRFVPSAAEWWQGMSAAAVASLLFEKYLLLSEEDQGLRTLARWLNEQGVPSPSRASKWTATTLRQIFRNPVYTGDFIYAKTRQPMHGTQIPQPQDQWIVASGNHEPLISKDTWQRVQAALDHNRTALRAAHKPAGRLLAGFMVCADCGSTLVPRYITNSRRTYYTCGSRYNTSRRNKNLPACPFPFLREDDLNAAVWQVVESLASDPGELFQRLEHEHAADGRREALERRLAQARADLERCDFEEERLMDASLQELFRPELVRKRLQDVRERRADAQRRLQQALRELREAEGSEPFLRPADPETVRRYLAGLLAGRDLDLPQRRELLAKLVGWRGIRVHPDGAVEINLKVPGDGVQTQIQPARRPTRGAQPFVAAHAASTHSMLSDETAEFMTLAVYEVVPRRRPGRTSAT
jgi:Site-specific recombinases, DNA invertase Pin homologs